MMTKDKQLGLLATYSAIMVVFVATLFMPEYKGFPVYPFSALMVMGPLALIISVFNFWNK